MIWALVALTATFWGLRQAAGGPRAPEYTVPVATGGLERGDLTRLLGRVQTAAPTEAPPPAISSRFRLVGVVAPRYGDRVPAEPGGVALIAIDGKSAKAFRVGTRLDGELTLRSVSVRSAAIGPAGAPPLFTLQLPPPAAAATGALPPPDMSIPEGGTAARPPRLSAQPQPPAYHRESGVPPPPAEAPEGAEGGVEQAVPVEEVGQDVPDGQQQ